MYGEKAVHCGEIIGALEQNEILKAAFTPMIQECDVPLDLTKTIRCVKCRSEFTDEETIGASACPKCGSKGVPMSIPPSAGMARCSCTAAMSSVRQTKWLQSGCSAGL